MKRIVLVALPIFVLLVAALIIGPFFIDWNKYKPQIIEQAKLAAGYDVRIDGDLSLTALPLPTLKIEGLSVVAPRGKEQNLLTMEQAKVSVNILPLLSGNISIDTVRLVKPDIRLEILADGSNSWMSDKLLADNNTGDNSGNGNGASAKKSSNDIALNKLIIEDGRVSYSDARSGAVQSVENINTQLRADTLQGPYAAVGTIVYNGKTISIDASTERGVKPGEMPAEIEIGLPDVGAMLSFDGIVATSPIQIQGKMQLSAANLAAAIAPEGGTPNPALSRKLEFSGLVTADENTVRSEDMAIAYGDTEGKGSLLVSNLKAQNPVTLQANLGFEGVLNFDALVPAKNKAKEPSIEEKVAKGQKLSGKAGLIPDTLSLPFPLEAAVKITAEGVQSGGNVFKGVVADVTKKDRQIGIAAKIMEMPGKTQAQGSATILYGSASKSGEKGVTYADPSVTFSIAGGSEQLPTLLRSFAPAQDGNAALEIYKTAQFDIDGTVTADRVSFRNSTVKLDQTTLALAGSYAPAGKGGRPDIAIDLTTDVVDIDNIMSRLQGQKKQAVQKDTAAKPDLKKSLEPVRSFESPVNLTFDISAQKAIYNQQPISGIRLIGAVGGQGLSLTSASVQDYMGAVASLKGGVANLKDLSGVDLTFYGKTSDVKSLLQSFQVDTSKIPASVSGATANLSAKGTAENLDFKADVAALDGHLKASGKMTGLLTTPAFSDLSVGAQHPNLVRAVQIVNPAFTGGPGLEKPFSFNARAVQSGKSYNLSGMEAMLGETTLGGNLQIDTGGAKPDISGKIEAGDIPLDSLLGAKTSARSGGGGGNAAASNTAGGGKWSRSTIETGWMHTINVNLDLSAKSITYGGWNFVRPTTKITLKDGNLAVDGLQSGLFGGTARLDAKVVDPADPKQPLSMAVQSKMDSVNLEPLVTALSGTQRLKSTGTVSLDMNVQTTGLSAHGLVGSLQGSANLNGDNVVMKGFDLAQIGLAFVDTGKPMDRLNSIVGGATQSGETRFDTIRGTYAIAQGIATISSMAMDGPAANIVSKGNVNLPQWTIDTVHTITFKQAKDAGAFDVHIKGPLDTAGNTFGRGLFNDVLTRRVQQKVMEKLPDVLGDDLGGKLQDLGILPPKQPKTPAQPQQPATQPDDAAQPAPEQPKKVSPEDQLKDDADKALRGVLDGLLR